MKHKIKLLLFLLLIFQKINSQNKIIKVLVDSHSKQPLISATINNERDYTITNKEGHFVFMSKTNLINIRMLGYEELKTSFTELNKTSDTIFLKQKTYELEEVIIENKLALLSKVYNHIEENYPHFSYDEKFFLRSLLKKNNKIIKLEDIYGKVNRNTLFTSNNIKKIDFKIELLNLRKSGILEKSKSVSDFELLSLEQLFRWFSTVFINYKQYNFTLKKTNDSNFSKLTFSPKEEFIGNSAGYYIINLNDFSIKEFFSQINPVFPKNNIPFKTAKRSKWRTIDSNIHVYFEKKETFYSISSVKIKQTIEAFDYKNNKILYNAYYDYISVGNFLKEKLNSNISIKKDIFKLKYKYSKHFWQNQNQLILTKEMQIFLDNLDKKEKDFLIFSNINSN